jgi:3-oxoacyl-[acyl-carrier protein] reductase
MTLMTQLNLSGKTALVTGASRGIGKAIAHMLKEQGAFVIGTATSPEGAKSISAMLSEQGEGRVLNLSDKDNVENFCKDLPAINILVNNAGITRDNLLLRMKSEEWQSVIETNLSSVFYLSKAVLPAMLKARAGRIINISSVVALRGNAGQCNYAAAKAGMIGFSKSLALEVATRGITVNVVAPGLIETDMMEGIPETEKNKLLDTIPMKVLGKPQDIAYMVAFLASDAAGYITGEVLSVAGGVCH